MRRKPRLAALALAAVGIAVFTAPSLAAPCDPGITFGAAFAGSYACDTLGGPPGVPGPLGGLTFLDNDTLLIGGAANNAAGAIYAIDVTRGAGNHITGFSGSATLYATAPNIDGGLSFGPGGVLFFTGFPTNELGQIEPGSASPDKTVDLTSSGIVSSVGSLGFVPAGFAGAGGMKILSFNGGGWYDVVLTPDGGGTFDVSSATLEATLAGGPEGLVYVSGSNPGFAGNDSVLVALWSAGRVAAFNIDANGDPIVATETDFLTNLDGAEGAVIDPLTGDFLFSTFGGGDQVLVISGFVAPPRVPEPGTLTLLAGGLIGMIFLRRRRRA